MKKKSIISFVLILSMICPLFGVGFPVSAQAESQEDYLYNELLRLWYDEPGNISATGYDWMDEGLAIGNGDLGGYIYGGIAKERLHFNDKTLWTGGPGSVDNYNYGNKTTPTTSDYLEAFRQALDNKASSVTGINYGDDTYLYGLTAGTSYGNTGFGTYQDFGDIYLDFAPMGITSDSSVQNYTRDLDLNTAITGVEYDYNGAHYTRESFVSYPDKVMVTRLSSDENGKLSFDTSISLYETGKTDISTISDENGYITVSGSLSNNGLKFAAKLQVINAGGTLTANADGTISVTNADEVVLILATATDYANDYPTYRSNENPVDIVTGQVSSAAQKDYNQLLTSHLDDYVELFSRLDLSLDEEVPNITTSELMALYRENLGDTAHLTNLALGANVTASPVSGSNLGSNAVDGNTNTRWETGSLESATFQLEFGEATTFDTIAVKEYNVRTNGYTIDVSNDGSTWETINSGIRLGWDCYIELEPVTAKYIRVSIDKMDNAAAGFREFEVYNSSESNNKIISDAYSRALEVIDYQMGRYLAIAGSREDTLPTNLCGLWLVGSASSVWEGDYHFNVNVQMNYWPTLAANLAETSVSFNEYIESLVEPGRITAYYSLGYETAEGTPIGEGNGFVVHTKNNPFGYTAPNNRQEWGWNITGMSWALQNVYDYYRYTMDEEYLEETIYPLMKETANFWTNFLWWSENQGRYVVSPSTSPEQGPTVNGTTYDQSLVWQTFEDTIEAATVLGVDEDLIAKWQSYQDQLDPIMVGVQGQVKEWYEETTIGNMQDGDLAEISVPNWQAGFAGPHRHSSHLIGLYPGTLINKDNKEYMEAAMVSLEERGFDATGWSKAHKLNMWARSGDSASTYRLLRSMVGGGNAGILDNGLGSHGDGTNMQSNPVFQIDANFGLTAGINEMLLQSQLRYTQFLPAIPEEWSTGSVKGIVARGNFEIDMIWSDGTADMFTITSNSGGEFVGEYTGIANATIRDASGKRINYTTLSDDKISFETVLDGVYTIDFGTAIYNVTYDANSGTGTAPVDSNDYYINAEATVRDSGGITKDGYIFAGWNTKADGSGSGYTPGTIMVIDYDVTLYAMWEKEPETYSLSYNANGGAGTVVPQDTNNYFAGTVAIVRDSGGLTKDGYTFAGWNTKADGSGTGYSPGATLTVETDTTLYAMWEQKPVTYSVTYDSNGGKSTVPLDTNDYFADTVVTVRNGNSVTKEDFTFKYWNTKADGSGTSYNAGDIFTIEDNTTLYAVWSMPFTDVAEGEWYYNAIYYTYSNKLVDGTDSITFAPEIDMTREMFVTILARLEQSTGESISGYTNSFGDVQSGEWYTDAISWASAKNIVEGHDSETFGFGESITREQMAALFIRYADYKGITIGNGENVTYIDADSISDWAKADVEAATKGGLFEGEDDYFRPQRSSTRAEATQVFARFIQMYID